MKCLLVTIALLFIPLPSHAMKKTICLNMIVKNEKEVITRCLSSVLPLIDTWVIVDTGSTDGTQEIIRTFLKDIPGELHERPWVDFGHNRQEALELAKKKADYILFIDADDKLTFDEGFKLPELTLDFYAISTDLRGSQHWRPHLVKANLPWRWEGVVHEELAIDGIRHGSELDGAHYVYLNDGARSKDPATLKKDIQVLLDAIQKDPKNARNVFYLARTYATIKDWPNAIKHYTLRSEMEGGSEEEKFLASLFATKIQDVEKMDAKLVEANYIKAYESRPSRIEPLYYLVKRLNAAKNYKKSYEIAKKALHLPRTQDRICVEQWIYDFALLFEYSICASYCGHYAEGLDACDKILSRNDLPENYRQDTEENRLMIEEMQARQLQKELVDLVRSGL